MSDDEQYTRWLKRRQSAEVPSGFSDRVMSAIVERTARPPQGNLPRLLAECSISPWGQFAACCGALLVGAVPYLVFLAGSFAF